MTLDGDRLTTSGFTNPSQGRAEYVNNVFGSDQVIYTPFASAFGTDRFTYEVSDGKGGTDTATVTVDIAAQDIPGDRTTTARINVGDIITSEHTTNDFADFFAFEAIEGKTYVVNLEGAATGAGTMLDPQVAIYDSSGTRVLLSDDDGGRGLNALLTAEVYIWKYYIASVSNLTNNFSTGTYRLSLSEVNTIPRAEDDQLPLTRVKQ